MIYTFKNNKTGEVFEKHMRMAEKEPYLEDNPDLSLIITPVAMSYGQTRARDGGLASKTDSTFNDRMLEIKKTAPKAYRDRIDTK